MIDERALKKKLSGEWGRNKIKILEIVERPEANIAIVLFRRKTETGWEFRAKGISLDRQHGGWDLITAHGRKKDGTPKERS